MQKRRERHSEGVRVEIEGVRVEIEGERVRKKVEKEESF
jgi:hypothetical protein